MKRRLPPRRMAGGLLNLRAFKSAAYSTYCASAFVIFLGVYTGESPFFRMNAGVIFKKQKKKTTHLHLL